MIYEAISIAAILFSGVTAVFSILAFCKVVGLENSTHKIEYIAPPAAQPYNPPESEMPMFPSGEELAKKFNSQSNDFEDEEF